MLKKYTTQVEIYCLKVFHNYLLQAKQSVLDPRVTPTHMGFVIHNDYVHTGPDLFETGQIFVRFHLFTRDWTNFDTDSVETQPNEF